MLIDSGVLITAQAQDLQCFQILSVVLYFLVLSVYQFIDVYECHAEVGSCDYKAETKSYSSANQNAWC